MIVYNANQVNVKPLSAVYTPDDTVNLISYTEHFDVGYNLIFSSILSAGEDAKINKNNCLFLTHEKQRPHDFATILTPLTSQYPLFHTTYLKSGNTFAKLDTTLNVVTVSTLSADVDNTSYFEIEFIDDIYCAVRYFNGSSLSFLTYSDRTDKLTFTTDLTTLSDYSTYHPDFVSVDTVDSQHFIYLLNDTKDKITLFKLTSAGTKVVGYNPETTKATETLSAYFFSFSDSTDFTAPSAFDIIKLQPTADTISLSTNWHAYTQNIEENNLDIDLTNSVSDIGNNFLLSIPRLGIKDTKIELNLQPLKNQINSTFSQNKNSPYEDDGGTRHRAYRRIHSGVNQLEGYDSLYLNYHTNTHGLIFPKDRLTYFRIPYNFDPYITLNINDSTLVACGAIAGGSPLMSDKVFKKRVNDTETEYIIDELNGTFLCSWLSGNENTSTDPVWVDRYYNPNYTEITSRESLSASRFFIDRIDDDYDSVVSTLSAERVPVFDKRSDLVFEKGGIYAYYRVGNFDFSNKIGSTPDKLFNDFNEYKTYNGVDKEPALDTELVNIITKDGSSFAIDDNRREVQVPEIYDLSNKSYCKSSQVNNTGSFSLLFTLKSDDYQQPFTNQIIGNYINKGLEVVNESIVTPIITIPNKTEIRLYNTDFDFLRKYPIASNGIIKSFTRAGVTNNIWFVDSLDDIYEYDLAGVIQRKITPTILPDEAPVQDIEISPTHVYLSLSGASMSAYRYDLANETEDIILVPFIGPQSTEKGLSTRIHTSSRGSLLTGGVIGINSSSLSGNNSILDINGTPWYYDNEMIYSYDTPTSATITALSAASGTFIEQVNTDKNGDIWVLHNRNTITKLTSARNVVFTTTLTATPLSSTRFLDFVYEFKDKEYSEYAVIYNQSLSAKDSNVIKVTPTGIIRNVISLSGTILTPMSGWKTITGFDYLKKHEFNPKPEIKCNLRLKKLYSDITTSGYERHSLTYDISSLTPGWHQFAIIFNAEKGYFTMRVDGRVVDTVSLSAGKYSFYNVFSTPIFAGTRGFFNGITISNFVNQPTAYFSNNMYMKDVALYGRALSYYDILPFVKRAHNVRPIKWDVAYGQRSYIETVDRSFKLSDPGRKSEMFNININNTEITDSELRAEIENKIKSEITKYIPVHVELNKINWQAANPLSSFSPPSSAVNILDPTYVTSPSAGNSGYGL